MFLRAGGPSALGVEGVRTFVPMAATLRWASTQGRMDHSPGERAVNWLDRDTQKRLCQQSQELLQRARKRAVSVYPSWGDLREFTEHSCSSPDVGSIDWQNHIRIRHPELILLVENGPHFALALQLASAVPSRFHSLAPEKAALNHVYRYHRNQLDPVFSSWGRQKKPTSHDPRESYQGTKTGLGSSRFESGPSTLGLRPSKLDLAPSKYDPRLSEFDSGPSECDPGPSKFGPGSSRFDSGPSKFGPGSSRFDSGPSRFGPGSSRFDSGPSELDTGPCKFEPRPSKFVARRSSKDVTIEVSPGTYSVTVGSPGVTTTRMIEVDSGQIIDLSFPL